MENTGICCKCGKVINRKNKSMRLGNICRKCYSDPKTKHQYQISHIKSLNRKDEHN